MENLTLSQRDFFPPQAFVISLKMGTICINAPASDKPILDCIREYPVSAYFKIEDMIILILAHDDFRGSGAYSQPCCLFLVPFVLLNPPAGINSTFSAQIDATFVINFVL